MISESKEQKLLNAIFGNDSEAKSMKFTLNLTDVEVSVKRVVKKTNTSCSCSKCGNFGGKRQ